MHDRCHLGVVHPDDLLTPVPRPIPFHASVQVERGAGLDPGDLRPEVPEEAPR